MDPHDCWSTPVFLEIGQLGPGIELMLHDSPGFWEQLVYHDYGDPWRKQRYQGIEATSHLAARSCARAAAGDTERLHSGCRSPAVAWTPLPATIDVRLTAPDGY